VKSEAAVLQGSTRKRHRFEISLLRYQLSTTGDVTSLRLPFAFLKFFEVGELYGGDTSTDGTVPPAPDVTWLE
jgi:hypothetical protein